jgi:hypothetical protein
MIDCLLFLIIFTLPRRSIISSINIILQEAEGVALIEQNSIEVAVQEDGYLVNGISLASSSEAEACNSNKKQGPDMLFVICSRCQCYSPIGGSGNGHCR